MSKLKIFGFGAVFLFLTLLVMKWPSQKALPEDIVIEDLPVEESVALVVKPQEPVIPTHVPAPPILPSSDDSVLPPDVDRIAEIFTPYPPLLPIVETITYAGRVSWVTGRAAYLGDYASHYRTSKHFISRSLHGMGSYLSDVVAKGNRFNVLRTDKKIEFHLLLDLSRLKLWVYALDKDEDQKTLLKSYPVCAGRLNSSRRSGSLTPCGTFSLGEEIAVYKPGAMGTYKNASKEMIAIFGTRWIPLGREVAHCDAPCKGLGIHGAPYRKDPNTGESVEHRSCIGRYESNGCIRLRSEDIEELFALIVSRPSFIHIAKDFTEAKIPGEEKS